MINLKQVKTKVKVLPQIQHVQHNPFLMLDEVKLPIIQSLSPVRNIFMQAMMYR